AAYVAELEAQARALGVAPQVAITPPTAAIAEAYAASDLVLQLSRKPESFGRTVIEALATGRPVLGWAHGGVGELLQALQPPGAVSPFDTGALQAAAQSMLARPVGQTSTMRAALGRYTLQAMQDATLAVYDEFDDESNAESSDQ
ncbi:MAG: glycosyltransferase, partial [Pseudomonadota bacterium]|nr:glycosyltransferase [Pseudomonadota bacterium]